MGGVVEQVERVVLEGGVQTGTAGEDAGAIREGFGAEPAKGEIARLSDGETQLGLPRLEAGEMTTRQADGPRADQHGEQGHGEQETRGEAAGLGPRGAATGRVRGARHAAPRRRSA